MEIDLRWPLFLGANLLLVALLRLANDSAAALGVYFSLPALYALLPALHLPPRWGVPLCLLSGLAVAAPHPLVTATPLLLAPGLGYAIFRAFSSQLRRFRRLQILTALAVANAALVLLQCLLLGGEFLGSGVYWQRALVDILLSSLLIYPVGHWFIDLQYGAMLLSGTDPRADAPPQ